VTHWACLTVGERLAEEFIVVSPLRALDGREFRSRVGTVEASGTGILLVVGGAIDAEVTCRALPTAQSGSMRSSLDAKGTCWALVHHPPTQ